jgi:predicted nucleotidyltransferase
VAPEQSHMSKLDFSRLPELPQTALLKEVATGLWQRNEVAAIWLGGSMARGSADAYGDIDLRIAVTQQAFEKWETPDFELIFGTLPLAHHKMYFARYALLHHLLVANGDIYDLYIQSVETPPAAETRLILGCRHAQFLQALKQPPEYSSAPANATPETIRTVLEFYWLNAHKYRKVLYRNLDLLIWQGLNFFRPDLIRLTYILLTERDCGDLRQATIHALTEVVRVLQGHAPKSTLEVINLPTRTRAEKLEAIDRLHSDIAKVGRALAERYGFTYPTELEALVQKAWQDFKVTLHKPETD